LVVDIPEDMLDVWREVRVRVRVRVVERWGQAD
jgi:hypothetical protein